MITNNWKLDRTHSELFFKIKHLSISNITGSIDDFQLDVKTEGNDFGKVTAVSFNADSKSLSTNNTSRDKELQSPGFFDADNYRQLSFEGISFEKTGQEPGTFLPSMRKDFQLHGNLTIKGISKAMTLNGEFGGTAIDEYGQKKAGFTVRGNLNRNEFDVTGEGFAKAANVFLSDEVFVFGNIQLVKEN